MFGICDYPVQNRVQGLISEYRLIPQPIQKLVHSSTIVNDPLLPTDKKNLDTVRMLDETCDVGNIDGFATLKLDESYHARQYTAFTIRARFE
jgi:hypothetical protein